MMTPELRYQLLEVASLVDEAAKRHGVMSLAGMKAEASCRKNLAAYFRHLGAKVNMAHLGEIAKVGNKDLARSQAEFKARQIVRRSNDLLQKVLRVNIHEALLTADKQALVKEASSPVTVGPASGLLSVEAEAYAAEQAAKQVVGY
jgi:hypothetical protein